MIGRVTMLESLVDVLLPHRAGVLELPEWYGAALFAALAKGAMHKYIKRVPKPGGGYRYFYTVGGGGGVHHADHFVEGASFKHEGGHYHIHKTEGDTVHLRHDESGETKKVSKAELGAMLAKHHEAGLKAHREKAAARLAEAKANKASPKQIARLEAQAKAAGHEDPKARFGGLSGKAVDDFVARHMAASKQRNFERELFEKHRASAPSAHVGAKNPSADNKPSTEEHHRFGGLSGKAVDDFVARHMAASKQRNFERELFEKHRASAPSAQPARKEPKVNYRTKVSQSGPKTWDVEIFGPTGKSKHFRVGAPRDITSADDARKAALEEFHASGGPKDVA